MAERRPNRVVGGVHDVFWRFCDCRELRLQRCSACSRLSWPPVSTCETCGGAELVWERLAGTGRLVSWCTFEHRYYEDLPIPWDTILVELAEGPLFISNPVGFSRAEMAMGQELQVDFVDCVDDHGEFLLPVFRQLNGGR